jgi:hypothetical protein
MERAMCFSLEADLVAGCVIGVVGVDAMLHAESPATKALAAVPLLLGAHQLVEAAVWGGLGDGTSGSVDRAATWLYLLVSFGILPWFVPAVAAAIEPTHRRRFMWACAGIGVLVSGVLVNAMVRGSVDAYIDGHRITYVVPIAFGGGVVGAYVAVVGLPLLLSSHREVHLFGLANLVAAAVIGWVDARGFISLWCLWAAVTSFAIAVYLRRAGPRSIRDRTAATAAGTG